MQTAKRKILCATANATTRAFTKLSAYEKNTQHVIDYFYRLRENINILLIKMTLSILIDFNMQIKCGGWGKGVCYSLFFFKCFVDHSGVFFSQDLT